MALQLAVKSLQNRSRFNSMNVNLIELAVYTPIQLIPINHLVLMVRSIETNLRLVLCSCRSSPVSMATDRRGDLPTVGHGAGRQGHHVLSGSLASRLSGRVVEQASVEHHTTRTIESKRLVLNALLGVDEKERNIDQHNCCSFGSPLWWSAADQHGRHQRYKLHCCNHNHDQCKKRL